MIFTFSSPVPLMSQDYMMLHFPSDGLGARLAFTYQTCYSSITIACSLVGLDSLRIESTSFGRDMPADTNVTISIAQVMTPFSTAPSEPLTATIYDSSGYEVTSTGENYNEMTSLRLHVEQPNSLLFSRVEPHSLVPHATTNYKFEIITRNRIPSFGSFRVFLPPQISHDEDIAVLVCSSSTQQNSATNCFYESTSRSIIFSNVTLEEVPGGQAIFFEIGGLTNPKTSISSDSLLVYTGDMQGHFIDRSSDDLRITINCDYPCNECVANQPTKCTACTPDSKFPLFFESSCLDVCPSEYYSMDGICSKCSSGCLECTSEDNICTYCNEGFYLLTNTCLASCPDNYYSDPKQRLCVPCESPCETCSTSPTTCSSCDQKLAVSFYFEGACYTSCPLQISVYSLGQCLACSSNCATCAYGTAHCTTCHGENFLDVISYKCTSECPLHLSVATIAPQTSAISTGTLSQARTCEPCADQCATCSPLNIDVCTKCHRGFRFDEASADCLTVCPQATAELYVPLTDDFICVQCQEGCAECSYDRDHCTECKPNFVNFEYSCIKECPSGYAVDQLGFCQRDTLFCEYGWTPIDGICYMDVAHCEEGYQLNSRDNLCIPVPGVHLPGLCLGLAALWSLIILGTWCCWDRKRLSSSQVRSQLLTGYCMLQQTALLVMFGLSFSLGYQFVTSVLTFAAFASVLLNLAGAIGLGVLVARDLPFTHWRQKNYLCTAGLWVLSALYSFKSFRFLVSLLWRAEEFEAAFEDPYRTFYRPLSILSFIQTILCACPLSYISLYLIVQIPTWGYEIRTLGIEALILQIVITCLEVNEFIVAMQGVKSFPRAADLVKKQHRKGSKQIKVMGGIDDDYLEEEQVRLSLRACDGGPTSSQIFHSGSQLTPVDTAEVQLLGQLVKQVNHRSNLKLMEKNLPAQEAHEAATNNVKKITRRLHEERKNCEMHRHKQPRTFTEKEIKLPSGRETPFEPTKEVRRRVAKNFIDKNHPVIRGAVDLYETRSEGERTRDQYEFKIHYQEQAQAVAKRLQRTQRRARSFDENVLREVYDDFGVASDFQSSVSWLSYPPATQFFDDAYMRARAALFAEKVKSKFAYGNIHVKSMDVELPAYEKPECVAVRTQTVNLYWQQGERDPFESDDSLSSAECVSRVDSGMLHRIFSQVYDNITLGDASALNSARSHNLASIESGDLYLLQAGSSKKRQRKQVNILADNGLDSSRLNYQQPELASASVTKTHLEPPMPHSSLVPDSFDQPRDETMHMKEQDSEEALHEEMDRLEELSMNLEIEKPPHIKPIKFQSDSSNEDYADGNMAASSLDEQFVGHTLSSKHKSSRRQTKRDQKLEKVYRPDEHRLELMQREERQRLHRITHLNPVGSASQAALFSAAPKASTAIPSNLAGVKALRNGRQTSVKEIATASPLKPSKSSHEAGTATSHRGTEVAEFLSSAVNSSGEGVTATQGDQQTSAQDRAIGVGVFPHQPPVESDFTSQVSSRAGQHRMDHDNPISITGPHSERRVNSDRKHKRSPRRTFDKYEHGYLFDLQKPKLTADEQQKLKQPVPFEKDTTRLLNRQKHAGPERGKSALSRSNQHSFRAEKLRNLHSVYLRQGGRMSIEGVVGRPQGSASKFSHLQKQNYVEDSHAYQAVERTGRRPPRNSSFSNPATEIHSTNFKSLRPNSGVPLQQRPENMIDDLKSALSRMNRVRRQEQDRNQFHLE